MPRFPDTSRAVTQIRGSIFTALAEKLRAFKGEVYPLHVGDTWMEPVEGSRMEDLHIAELPGMHRYSQPEGLPRLVDLLVERANATTGVAHERKSVLVTTGATGALGAILGAILHPGDEVLLLAPYWPLIEGIVRAFHGAPVDVPFYGRVDSPETAIEALEPYVTERTCAIYVNTPNNPTGRVMPRAWLEAIAEWAARRGLWIVADEVYEDLVYIGAHTWCRTLAPDRTFSAHSFSKGWAMAGNRCGYVVGPAQQMAELRKVGTHTFYAAPTAAQLAVCNLLENPERSRAWLERAHRSYIEMGRYAAERLGVDPPAGSTFLFVDVSRYLDQRGLQGFLLDCGEHGVFVAPGPSFGPYPTHVRVCFTAAPPEVTRRGIDVLAKLLGR
jgi:N-succinyldiaminopimelate aminotransferase